MHYDIILYTIMNSDDNQTSVISLQSIHSIEHHDMIVHHQVTYTVYGTIYGS